jgi:hypothetical protein
MSRNPYQPTLAEHVRWFFGPIFCLFGRHQRRVVFSTPDRSLFQCPHCKKCF